MRHARWAFVIRAEHMRNVRQHITKYADASTAEPELRLAGVGHSLPLSAYGKHGATCIQSAEDWYCES